MELKFFSNLINFKKFMHKIDVQPVNFISATFLSLLSALCEAISIGTLIPMVKGMIGFDFNFIKQYSFFKAIHTQFPQVEALSNTTIFIIFLGIIFTAAVLKNVLGYIASLVLARQLRRSFNGLMQLIFARYLSFGKLFFDKTNIGYLHTVLLYFTNIVSAQFMQLEKVLRETFMLIVYLVIMLVVLAINFISYYLFSDFILFFWMVN